MEFLIQGVDEIRITKIILVATCPQLNCSKQTFMYISSLDSTVEIDSFVGPAGAYLVVVVKGRSLRNFATFCFDENGCEDRLKHFYTSHVLCFLYHLLLARVELF